MLKAVKVTAVFVAAVTGIALFTLNGTRAYAATDPITEIEHNGVIALEFKPVCSDAANGIARWEVTNKNRVAVEYVWANVDGEPTPDGDIEVAPAATDAQPSNSELVTSYYAGKNNETKFTYAGSNESIVSRNAASTACEADTTEPTTPVTPLPTPVTCVDVSDASNLNVVWNGDSQISISTKEPLPACETVSLYYSTYQMPDTYDGKGFNATAYPQTHLSSYQFNIEAGSYGTWVMNVPTPDYCVNVQADVYYAPHINGINADGQGYDDNGNVIQQSGHGTQNIASKVFMKNADSCVPGRGAGSTTITTSTPSVLPNTGAQVSSANIASALLSIAFGTVSLMALGLRTLRR